MTVTCISPQVGVALVGAGMIARTQVAALSAIGDQIRLHTIISRHPERAASLAEHYAGERPEFSANLATVTENPAVQFVIVATPPSVRIELIAALASAGKHILLEKPVARTTAEATRVVEICERAGVTLGVLFQHRMRASSKAALARIASGELGELGHVEISAPLWRDQSYYDTLGRGTYERDGGGVLITQAIHTIDLALSLTGPVASVQAMTATTPLHDMEAEDFAIAGLRFASGAVGSLVASTATFPHGEEVITLHFRNGSLRLSKYELVVYWRDGRIDIDVAEKHGDNAEGPVVQNHAWHQAMIEDFNAAIIESRAPIVAGRDALASHRLIEAIVTSSRLGQSVTVAQ